MRKRPVPKQRNPEARALQSPLFRKRVVPSAHAYRRQPKHRAKGSDD